MNPLVIICIRALEILFFAGWVGSILVVLFSAADDVVALISSNDDERDNGSRGDTRGPAHP